MEKSSPIRYDVREIHAFSVPLSPSTFCLQKHRADQKYFTRKINKTQLICRLHIDIQQCYNLYNNIVNNITYCWRETLCLKTFSLLLKFHVNPDFIATKENKTEIDYSLILLNRATFSCAKRNFISPFKGRMCLREEDVTSWSTLRNNCSCHQGVFSYDTLLSLDIQSLFRLASPTTAITIIIRSFALHHHRRLLHTLRAHFVMYYNGVSLLEITTVTALENGYYLASLQTYKNINSLLERDKIYHAHSWVTYSIII